MKKFPKSLATMAVLHETVHTLYSWAESKDDTAANYRKEMKDVACGDWYEEQIAECEAMAEAYRALAEKLSK